MAPPTGPRGASTSTRITRSSNAPPRGSARGGIAKRRGGAARVDRDGDLVMDPSASGRGGKKSGTGAGKPALPIRRRGASSSAPSSKSNTRLQQNLLRQMEPSGPRATRPNASVTLKIHGLTGSRASSNPDGGVEALLGFLERKANPLKGHSPPVTIKKVCLSIRSGDTGVYAALRKAHPHHTFLDAAIRADTRTRSSPLKPLP